MDPNHKDLLVPHEISTSTAVVDTMYLLYLNVLRNYFYPKKKEGFSNEDSKVSGGVTINALMSIMSRMTPQCPSWRRSR
jgi:hypothetical protein